MYAPGEQAVLALTGLLLCPLISFVVFKLARIRLRKVESDSLRSRAYLFYLILSGILLGQCIGHLDLGTLYAKVFFALGYFLFNSADTLGRIWNTNSNIVAIHDEDSTEDATLNKDTMEDQTVIVSNDITSPHHAHDLYGIEVSHKVNRKRQWILGCLLLFYALLSFSNGLNLVYRGSSAATITCYVFNGAALSVSVYGAMIHAKFHVTEEVKPRLVWWIAATIIWCLIYFSSSIFVLAGMQAPLAAVVLTHEGWIAFYAMAAGAILRLQQYFHNMKCDATQKSDYFVGLVVFGLSLGQSLVTSYFL